MSPNIARPLTLRTSPSDYATFNQIKKIISNIRLVLEREKQQKVFTLCVHCCAGVDFGKKLQKLLKIFRPKFQMTQISNYLFRIKFVWKLIVENNLVLLYLEYFVKAIH